MFCNAINTDWNGNRVLHVGWWNISFMPIKFEQFFQLHNTANWEVLTFPIFVLFIALVFVFVKCELAERLSIGFDDINDMIDDFDWYLFPHAMQNMLPIIMMYAQQRVGFECFGSCNCNRALFERVSWIITWQQIPVLILNVVKLSGGQLWILVLYGTSSIWIE